MASWNRLPSEIFTQIADLLWNEEEQAINSPRFAFWETNKQFYIYYLSRRLERVHVTATSTKLVVAIVQDKQFQMGQYIQSILMIGRLTNRDEKVMRTLMEYCQNVTSFEFTVQIGVQAKNYWKHIMDVLTNSAHSWKLKHLRCADAEISSSPGYFDYQYHFVNSLNEVCLPPNHQDFNKLLDFNRLTHLRFGKGSLKAWNDWFQQPEMDIIKRFMKKIRTLELVGCNSITENEVACLNSQWKTLEQFVVNRPGCYIPPEFFCDSRTFTSLLDFAFQNSREFFIVVPIDDHSKLLSASQQSSLYSYGKIDMLRISTTRTTSFQLSLQRFSSSQGTIQTNIHWDYIDPTIKATTIEEDVRKLRGNIDCIDISFVDEAIDSILCAMAENGLKVRKLDIWGADLVAYTNETSSRGTCITELALHETSIITDDFFPALSHDLPQLNRLEMYNINCENNSIQIVMDHTTIGEFLFGCGNDNSFVSIKLETLDQNFTRYFVGESQEEVSLDAYNNFRDSLPGREDIIDIHLRCKSIQSFSFNTNTII